MQTRRTSYVRGIINSFLSYCKLVTCHVYSRLDTAHMRSPPTVRVNSLYFTGRQVGDKEVWRSEGATQTLSHIGVFLIQTDTNAQPELWISFVSIVYKLASGNYIDFFLFFVFFMQPQFRRGAVHGYHHACFCVHRHVPPRSCSLQPVIIS